MTTPIITDYLTQLSALVGDTVHNTYAWLLSTGQAYDAYDPATIDKRRQNFAFNTARPRSCFDNARKASMRFEDAVYVEGFYVTKDIGIPFEHAWTVIAGKVYDPTALLMRFEVTEYFGVEIPVYYLGILSHKSFLHMYFDDVRRGRATDEQKFRMKELLG